jgi:hypothetical protein
MRRLAPFITARGDVYRAMVLGHFDTGAGVAGAEVVVDATRCPARLVFFQEFPRQAAEAAAMSKENTGFGLH